MRPHVMPFAAALGAASVLVPPALAQAAPSASGQEAPPAPPPPTTASAYLTQASSADQFEIRSSQHALQISQDPGIKSAAQMIIADHTRLSNELKAAAISAGIAPPRASAKLIARHRSGPTRKH